ncbi:hypothetical protein [Shewanella violacea]|uniref:Uncharacterized protein n=1 Tax=Shewanella violacea (strain JCM 10179 / CIP 106290 / LMG 19151 / DSS12) TaxID=637905 RepID=D4ZKE4_SHEVD|nr:hypothetical protein [Shewanella violacea]BAJ02143.1 conserved hypothetical protein [Shewanella violacea DSS12]
MLSINLPTKLNLYTPVLLAFLCTGCTPEQQAETDLPPSILVEDTSLCNFSQAPCNKQVTGINLLLLVTPFNTPSGKPLTIKLASSEAISDVKMRVEGRDMFMGVIPVNLSKLNEKQYNGTLIYGSCSSNYMVWRAFVSFTHKGESHVTHFDFLADSGE